MGMEQVLELLRIFFGYTTFRPGQAVIIRNIMEGRDTVGILPTGGGKSICYQIPALLSPGLVLVISPLISLMKDQVDALNSQGIAATYLNSSLAYETMTQRMRDAKKGLYKLIYIAPERLEGDFFKAFVRDLPVFLIAVDEAHCVSQWGHDFRPSYLAIADCIEGFNKRPPVAAFTATATTEVTQDIVQQLKLQNPLVHVSGFDRPNLFFSVLRLSLIHI